MDFHRKSSTLSNAFQLFPCACFHILNCSFLCAFTFPLEKLFNPVVTLLSTMHIRQSGRFFFLRSLNPPPAPSQLALICARGAPRFEQALTQGRKQQLTNC